MKKQTFIHPGDKFNRLTAVKFDHIGKHNRRYFLFACDCGKQTIITAEAAISGNTKSCGCLSHEIKKSKLFPENKGVINQVILGYKRHAKDRGFEFSLSFDEVKEIIESDCYYCGADRSNTKVTKNCLDGYKYNGIDRIDSRKGYEMGNVVSACKLCNLAKRDLTIEEFYVWVKRLSKRAEQWGNL